MIDDIMATPKDADPHAARARFRQAIQSTPLIDNHAHPLLKFEALHRHPFESITSEAHGNALFFNWASLAHLRAVKQLANLHSCEPRWEAVVSASEGKRIPDEYDDHVRQCLSGIHTILVDDGLGTKDEVCGYQELDEYTTSPCWRIVRIERVVEDVVGTYLEEPYSTDEAAGPFDRFLKEFDAVIGKAIDDPKVAGFKSVICYRTGLAIPRTVDENAARKAFDLAMLEKLKAKDAPASFRLSHDVLNNFFVHRVARLIQDAPTGFRKVIQFHTGLGDNDITLTKASPSHLQEFIREYPGISIVLLHASYPFMREAAYLATTYANVWVDIGEVFPCLSRGGQENVIREIMELAPWTKVLFSTDGHYFPETYYLAQLQAREVLETVLSEFVRKGDMTWKNAEDAVKAIFFLNSNNLYRLMLSGGDDINDVPGIADSASSDDDRDKLQLLRDYVNEDGTVEYLRIYWNDMTGTTRMRALSMDHVWRCLRDTGDVSVCITKAGLALLQNDTIAPGVTATGEYKLHPDFTWMKFGPREHHMTVFGDFREQDGSPVSLCPRTALRNAVEAAESHGLEFKVGFELELILMERDGKELKPLDHTGHSWSAARIMDHPVVANVIEKAVWYLKGVGVSVQQIHPESAPGQFELVLPPATPLAAVDTLLYVREVVSNVATAEGYRMTLHPKPFPNAAGTAAHVHISLASEGGDKPQIYQPFYAGILKHLRAICAFTYSSPVSYLRVVDSCWAGGRWVAWGTQNRETALRKIQHSHWEIKTMDGMANPYLSLATIIHAGVLGVLNGEELAWGDCEIDPANLTDNDRFELSVEEMLPEGLPEALKALRNDEELCERLGEELVERYVGVKHAEMRLVDKMGEEELRKWVLERY